VTTKSGFFSRVKSSATFWVCNQIAGYRANALYPESLTLDLRDLLAKPRQLRVAIIDNQPFPWQEALENRGCKVTYVSDYTKPVSQAGQKYKTYSFDSQDIILCDIHDVGTALYPGLDGLGVMEDLRRRYPLHLIAAYTGNPGAIYTRLKQQTTLDFVFARDWRIEDFLFNFDELSRIFFSPKHRWVFIQCRLKHLGVADEKVHHIRCKFVQNILLSQMLKKRFHFSNGEAIKLLTSETSAFDMVALAKFGVGAAEFASLISPFILE
jgi:hypothetical protein